jgi:AraC-like DNA-binding protein
MKKIENVHYRRVPELKGIESCRVIDSHHVFPKHAHEDIYAIGVMEKGGSYCLGPERKESFVAPGQIALINPGQVHSGVPEKDVRMTYCMLYVDTALMQDAASDICEKESMLPEFRHMIIRDPVLWKMFERLYKVFSVSGGRLEKESVVLEALGALVSGYGGVKHHKTRPGEAHREIRLAREFLAENLSDKLSLETVAASVGFSRYHFLRVFKKMAGVPPHVFRTQRRIDAAKRLIRRGMPFAEVALETGFTDQSHFTNKFRQFTGATPSQYLSGDW